MEMNWIFLALLAPFCWAIGNIINKIIRTKHINCSISYAILIAPIDLLALFLLFFSKPIMPSLIITFICLFAGLITIFGTILYFKALSIEEVSRVIPLFRFVAIFVLILAAFFLKERLYPLDYLAFILIVLGGFLISVRKIKGVFKFRSILFIMIFSSFIYSVHDILVKYASGFTNVVTYFILVRIGHLIGALFLFSIPFYKKSTINIIKKLNKKTILFIISSKVIGLLGVLFAYTAISLSSVSLVVALESFQPLFVLILASLLSFKFPHLIKEELNKKVLLTKVIAIVLMIIGVGVLYLR